MTTTPFTTKSYLMTALDPVHVGTGGYRLGRVDNTIVREPGSGLPKIPGSSIAGVCRSYTAMHPHVNKYPECAGKGGEHGEKHCGDANCPVCVCFGFSKGKENLSFKGLAQFSDANILFFPVHSMIGPVWITSPMALAGTGTIVSLADANKFQCLEQTTHAGQLNFGWLMLDQEINGGPAVSFSFPLPAGIADRLFLVSDKLFSHIVNNNLEVRTSVAIDPETGAAQDKALFTYEAIPRSAILTFDAVLSNPLLYRIREEQILLPPCSTNQPGDPEHQQMEMMVEYIELGFSYMKSLGLGSMNTRGFGRVNITQRDGVLC